jgi:hypothetical protein
MRFSMRTTSRLLPLLVAAVPVLAQGVSVQLSGQILTREAKNIAGAAVVIRNQETGLVRNVQTDENGRFIAPLLPVGPYAVTVTKAGYQTISNIRVRLNLGDAAPLRVTMVPETGATVEIVATTSSVDSERASAATFISPGDLTNLPVLNRSFTSLATLAPQVTIAARGNLAIGGQRGVNTSINIDGGDNNEPFFGGALGAAENTTPFTISMEAIREFQVVSDGASAEFGRMGGGYVNAITKSGTNDFVGSLFFYKRPKSMIALNPKGTPGDVVGDFKQDQFGFSVGGPIIADKLFYFLAYDGQRRTEPINFRFGMANPVALEPATYANDRTLEGFGGGYDARRNSDALFARIDWILSLDHTFQFRLNQSKYRGDTYVATPGYYNTYSNSLSDDIDTTAIIGQWNWNISSNWLNEFRINHSGDDMPRNTRSNFPMVTISGVADYGANANQRVYTAKRLQIQESILYADPNYQVKAGFDYNKVDVQEIYSAYWMGSYSFRSSGSGATYKSALQNFREGNWSSLRQKFSLQPGVDAWNAGNFDAPQKQLAAFVQADFRLAAGFKVGLGLRWDKQEAPSFPVADFSDPLAAKMPVTQSLKSDSQVSPRLSFTWTPVFDPNSVVRGSVGRYVSVTPSLLLYGAFADNGDRMGQVDFQSTEAATYNIPRGATFNAANPYWMPSFPTGKTIPATRINTFAPDFKNPRTDRFNLGYERGFTSGFNVGVSGTYAKAENLQRWKDINLGTPTINAMGRWVYPSARPNTKYTQMMMCVSDATSQYHAYTLTGKYQKEGSPFYAQLSYTYAIDKDNDSNERTSTAAATQDPNRLSDDWGPSDRDIRHTITGQATYHERRWTGLQFGLIYKYYSGLPYNVVYYGDQNRDGSYYDRPFVNGVDIGRNSYRTGSQQTFDIKISRDIQLYKKVKLQLSADIFNLLNRHDTYARTNVSDKTESPTAPAAFYEYSYPYIRGDARQVQLGVRLSF